MGLLKLAEKYSDALLEADCKKALSYTASSSYKSINNILVKLCADSVELINYARNIVVNHVNIVQIMTYYSLGRRIVETQQMGEKRAKYGSKVIKTLSENLQKEFGKGFSEDTLKNARKFYLTYKERISETVFSLFAIEKSETVFSFFEKEPPFIVSWSHYLQLMRIENEAERSFNEIETQKQDGEFVLYRGNMIPVYMNV